MGLNIPTKDQIIRQIKFELNQLSIRNAQFEFEHLCRHLTRARICSNILVATGPVVGSGDQGRDFETFRTYLENTEFFSNVFTKLSSKDPIAFACSIQKDNIDYKIKSDVEKIMASGTKVEAIFFFNILDIKISDRHDLIDWAENEHSVHLEIIDGENIAELLAERDVFWIAERYLSISAELYPREKEDDPLYKNLYEKYQEEELQFTYAEFYQIQKAARHTIFNEKFRQDISFWIGLLEKYLEIESFLKWKAIYEVVWLSLKGFQDLRSQEENLKEYFSRIPILVNLQDLEDTGILIQYLEVAISQGIIGISFDELNDWLMQLTHRIDNLIEKNPLPYSLCSLLMTRGVLTMNSNMLDAFQQGVELDFTNIYEWWKRLVDIVDEAPLFHLDTLAKLLNMFITYFDKDLKFRELIETVDEKLSEKKGGAIIAENCRDRAENFYRDGQTLNAINEFHKAKLNWFAEDTIHESLIAMLKISSYYNELGLTMAGKYYALAAAFIALNYDKPMLKPIVPRALFLASDSDYSHGNWMGFLEIIRIAFYFHNTLSINPWDFDFHSPLYGATFHITILLVITKLFNEDLHKSIKDKVENFPIFSYIEYTYDRALDNYCSMEINELWAKFEEELAGRPFNDIGEIRNFVFSVSGIKWEIEWQNNYDTTVISEQFISILQILLAELTNIDLCLLKTTIMIEIILEENRRPSFESISSNVGRKWRIKYPISLLNDEIDIREIMSGFFPIISAILYEISMLTIEEFRRIYNQDFFEHISTKIMVGNSYIKVFRQFIQEETFNLSNRSAFQITQFDKIFNLKESEELKWYDAPGPGYSSDRAIEFLTNRYEQSTPPIRITLNRIREAPEIIEIIRNLKSNGWLDWQILGAISSIASMYRIKRQGIQNFQESMEQFRELSFNEELEDSVEVPLSEFSMENFKHSLNASLISTLNIWGLECHQRTPDIPAIKQFLDIRYNNRADDIEHENPF